VRSVEPIVNNQDFKVEISLGKRRMKRSFNKFLRVVGRNDNRNQRALCFATVNRIA
jgi:hypothetical protein